MTPSLVNLNHQLASLFVPVVFPWNVVENTLDVSNDVHFYSDVLIDNDVIINGTTNFNSTTTSNEKLILYKDIKIGYDTTINSIDITDTSLNVA